MAKEDASWITELVDTNPLDTDPVAEGNDHIQMIKSVLRNSFPSPSTTPVVPNMSGQSGKVLSTDGTNSSWSELSSVGLTNPFLFNGVQLAGFAETVHSFSEQSGTLSCDLSLYTTFAVNRNAACTVSPTNVSAGAVAFTLIASGSGDITHPANTIWSNGVVPTLVGGTEIFTYITINSGANWYGFHAGQAMS